MASNKTSELFAHFIGWCFFAMLPIFFILGRNELALKDIIFSWPFGQFMLSYMLLFYIVYLWLIPSFLLKRQAGIFVGAILLLFIGIYLLQPFDDLVRYFRSFRLNRQGPPPRIGRGRSGVNFDIVSIALFLVILSFATALQLIRKWQLEAERAARAEAGKANAELSFLKAQIHPHFLFNTLNNIYSMAIMNHDQTAESILKLSNIMRYVTDEISMDFVPLEEEVNCIRDYIDLQKLRTGDKVNLHFEVTGELSHQKIAPLIFMSFIENVFKYGISKHEPCDIEIKISVEHGGIKLFCRNRIYEQQQHRQTAGIGISNSRQRLELLYPGKHSLDIESKNGLFTVELILIS